MGAPNIPLLTALVLSSDATYHTRSPSVFEQIKTRVWAMYRSADDIPPTEPPDDVNGLAFSIYFAFNIAGVTSALGGVAYWLEQLTNQVLTYPYTRSDTDVLDVPD